ncbi:serine hydrolase FSH [Rhypophila decipiens]|uniref:Serine hydrolase FSH n=1 Tax=Rhypophila decipiens TaxID=261697 RepID=A0AAN7B7L2_9PEZI|nr:serine hydrolase FSH [Rhypophila decipiens]
MRPKLLFLHGGGTNAEIFRLQARKLAQLLTSRFEIVFPEGFNESWAGPGVLPMFEGCEPFRQWLYDTPSKPEPEEPDWSTGVPRLIKEVLEPRGPFVGVVGFSQGAKAAMHLLRFLEKRERETGEVNPIMVMVSVCGTAPFQGVKDPADPRAKAHEDSLALGKVETPSIHLIAEDDPWKPESEALLEFFDPGTRGVIKYKGGHYMPKDDELNQRIVDFVNGEYDGMY